MAHHVIPTGDPKLHMIGRLSCWCEPKVEFANRFGVYDEPVVIHNASDGREFREIFKNVDSIHE